MTKDDLHNALNCLAIIVQEFHPVIACDPATVGGDQPLRVVLTTRSQHKDYLNKVTAADAAFSRDRTYWIEAIDHDDTSLEPGWKEKVVWYEQKLDQKDGRVGVLEREWATFLFRDKIEP